MPLSDTAILLKTDIRLPPELSKPARQSSTPKTSSIFRKPSIFSRPSASMKQSPLGLSYSSAYMPQETHPTSDHVFAELIEEIQGVHTDFVSLARENNLLSWRGTRPDDEDEHHAGADSNVHGIGAAKVLEQNDTRLSIPQWLSYRQVLMKEFGYDAIAEGSDRNEDDNDGDIAGEVADREPPLTSGSLPPTLSPVTPRRSFGVLQGTKQNQPRNYGEGSSTGYVNTEDNIFIPHRKSVDLTYIPSLPRNKISNLYEDSGSESLMSLTEALEIGDLPIHGVSYSHLSRSTQPSLPVSMRPNSWSRNQRPRLPPRELSMSDPSISGMRIMSRHQSMQKRLPLGNRTSLPSLHEATVGDRTCKGTHQDHRLRHMRTHKEELRERVLRSLRRGKRSIPSSTTDYSLRSIALQSQPRGHHIYNRPSATRDALLQQRQLDADAKRSAALHCKLDKWYATHPRDVLNSPVSSIYSVDAPSIWSVQSGAAPSEDLYMGKYGCFVEPRKEEDEGITADDTEGYYIGGKVREGALYPSPRPVRNYRIQRKPAGAFSDFDANRLGQSSAQLRLANELFTPAVEAPEKGLMPQPLELKESPRSMKQKVANRFKKAAKSKLNPFGDRQK